MIQYEFTNGSEDDSASARTTQYRFRAGPGLVQGRFRDNQGRFRGNSRRFSRGSGKVRRSFRGGSETSRNDLWLKGPYGRLTRAV